MTENILRRFINKVEEREGGKDLALLSWYCRYVLVRRGSSYASSTK